MPIDLERAIGARIPPSRYSWADEDVILYHLGIGAGSDPIEPSELRYAYEGDLVVIPTFATIPPFSLLMGFVSVDGVDVNLAQILHGEQETIVHREIPTSGSVVNEGVVTGIYDKGSGALARVEVVSTLEESQEPVFTNISTLFIKGEGGWGGDTGPSTRVAMPERDPDRVVASPTLPQQALLYRVASGDRNPLHADPGFAAFAGYERPILHGLCTYGIVCKAVIDSALDCDPTRVASYRGRFSGVVYPGETIQTRIWDEGDSLVVDSKVVERGEPVLTEGVLVRR